MKKVLVLVFAAFVSLSLAGCGKKAEKGEYTLEKGILKVGMEIGYPPMEYYAEDGKTPMGFDVQLAKAVADKLGLQIEYIDTAWDGIFAGLETDKYDVIFSACTITDERKSSMDFSTPYVGNGQSLILTKDSKKVVTGPADLTGLTVGYQAETTSDIYMTKLAEKGLKFRPAEYDKVINAYEDLKYGRCDVVISDALVAAAYLTLPDTPYVSVWTGEADEYFGAAVKKGNSVLTTKINSALEELFSDGTMKSIYEDVFAADLTNTVK